MYAEAIKCQEIIPCAHDVTNGTSRDLAKMSKSELQQRALRSAFEKIPPNLAILIASLAGRIHDGGVGNDQDC